MQGVAVCRLLPTLTFTRAVPGATPSTPCPLFLAPMMPAQCVPCWYTSSVLPPGLTVFTAATTFKSGWLLEMPVSSTATATSAAGAASVELAEPMRMTPGAVVWEPVLRGTAGSRGDNVEQGGSRVCDAWHCCCVV